MNSSRPPAAVMRYPVCSKEGQAMAPQEFLEHLQELEWYQGEAGGAHGGRAAPTGSHGSGAALRVASGLMFDQLCPCFYLQVEHIEHTPARPACLPPPSPPPHPSPPHTHVLMQVEHIEHTQARTAQPATPSHALSQPTLRALASKGITQPYSHQAAAIDALINGRHVVIATSTASGKSLCYTGARAGLLALLLIWLSPWEL